MEEETDLWFTPPSLTPPSSPLPRSSHLSPSSAPTWNDLPTELVLRIFETLVEEEDLDRIEHYSIGSLFCSAALVRRSWAIPAQTIMALHVVCRTEQKAKEWLESKTFGVYTTKSLRLDSRKRKGGVLSGSATRILESLPYGLEKLELLDLDGSVDKGFNLHLFGMPNLSQLTQLKIAATYFSNTLSIPLSTSFKIHSLEYDDSTSTSLKHNFFSIFPTSALTSLTLKIHEIPRGGIPYLHDFLRSAGPGLETLDLYFTYRDLLPNFLPLFGLFQNLHTLRIHCDDLQLVDIASKLYTPSKLKELELYSGLEMATDILFALRTVEGMPSLKGLEKLCLCEYTREEFERRREGRELLKAWERKGVQVSFDCS